MWTVDVFEIIFLILVGGLAVGLIRVGRTLQSETTRLRRQYDLDKPPPRGGSDPG